MTVLLVLGLVGTFVALRRHRRPRGPAPMGGCPAPRRRRRTVLVLVGALLGAQAVLGLPASAQIFDDCKEAPNPERPGSGMVGALDPTPLGQGAPGSVYHEVGYAGLVWHTYDLGCGPSGIRDPNAVIDTWTGNQLFNIGKNIIGATNGLHYALLDGGLLEPVDDLVMTGTIALYDSVYAPFFGLVAVLLAVVLFRSIWRGDLATVGKRGLWALAGLWVAAATYLTPLVYTHALDGILVDGSAQVQAGFLEEAGIEQRHALPTLLHEQVVYRNWLRGEFGSPDSPQARELGRDLVRAQAWTKQEVADGADAGSPDAKKAAYEDLANRMGGAYGTFQGVDGSRIGAGFLGMLQATVFALFQLLAKAAILLAQVLLRVVILAGPVIGLVALLHHELLRGVGRAVGSALLNVIVLAALAGLHVLVLTWVFDPARGLPLLAQMLLAGLITLVLLLVARPMRRMWQMVELSVGAVGRTVPGGPPGVLARLRSRGVSEEARAQDRFWNEVRAGGDPDLVNAPVGAGNGRVRPEGGVPVVAVAERLDRTGPDRAAGVRAEGPRLSPGGSGGEMLPAGPAADPPALPAGAGRSAPASVFGAAPARLDAPAFRGGGDAADEDAVLVPSRAEARVHRAPSPGARRAELEMVEGRPVWLVYRPSRGLEVGDPGAGTVRHTV